MQNYTFGFIGLGLIGGSIAKALRLSFKECTILAYDINFDALSMAKEDVVDNVYNNVSDAFSACDIIFFSLNAARLPVLQNMVAMRSTPENSNAMMGFYQSMNSLGGIFGALFAGLIYEANPIYPFILAFAAFTTAVVIGVVYVTKYKKEKGA